MQTGVFSAVSGAALTGASFPPVKPRWLSPATTVAVVLAHIGVAALLTVTVIEKMSPLDSLGVDLVPEGDTLESEQVEAMDEAQVKPAEMQEPDLAIPPPQLMMPEAIPLPPKKEVQPKRRVERKQDVAQSSRHQEGSERHRLGVAGGRASSLSRAGYAGLLAAAIRRHVPQFSSLGSGTASCSFHVSAGGGIFGVSCSGSTTTHTAMLRSGILATHAPPPPGGSFFGAQAVHFQ